MRGELARRRQVHEAEAARIVVDDARAVIEVKYHMIMKTFARGALQTARQYSRRG